MAVVGKPLLVTADWLQQQIKGHNTTLKILDATWSPKQSGFPLFLE